MNKLQQSKKNRVLEDSYSDSEEEESKHMSIGLPAGLSDIKFDENMDPT